MSDEVYTLAAWRVRPGNEDAFVAAWTALGEVFRALPMPPGDGTLVRSADDPLLFYSFGPWPSMAAVLAMRATPTAVAALEGVRSLCAEASPGAYTVVARA